MSMRCQHAFLLLIQISATVAIALPGIPALEYAVGVHYRKDLLGMLASNVGTDSRATSATSPSSSTPSTMYPGLGDLNRLLTDSVISVTSSLQEANQVTPTNLGITSFPSSPKSSTEHLVPTFTITRSTNYSTTQSAPSASTTEDPDTENKTWKIIGIAFIAILIIAIAVTSNMFFDRWRKVAQQIFCCKGRPDDKEQLIPDWEKQTWEVKLGPEECDYNQRAIMSVRSDTGGHTQKGDIHTMRNSADHVITTLPLPALRVIGPSHPRELPWDSDDLHQCILHRQLSTRSGRHRHGDA
ncbi:hypothetical protein K503DRAFT_864929 [Rhizopogon vinicolor AM-OR11-026]|uniref:Amine oxidase domain-containing protein n=1 Tax=Rhizopogon vinicolor AM-OR11-026 TaxID=1314800 RepID=A0A1B7N5F4_9AGAM|nr:hypothetical protein K503DRAFT_864929 [Rhizopogon vinicolor AM-OR11-026]